MNPYIGGAVLLVLTGGAYFGGWRHANLTRDSVELAAEKERQEISDKLIQAVEAIPVKFIPLKGAVQKEITHEVRYTAAECEHTDAMWGVLKQTYEAAGGQWGEASLPAPSTSVDEGERGDNPRPGRRVGGPRQVP